MAHDIEWYSPAPFWAKRLENGTRTQLQEPVLLGFERDDFMTAFQRTLSETPNALPDWTAQWEEHSAREGRTGRPDDVSDEAPIPLYQPVHKRHYLVTASLVCRTRGLPDRAVDTANDESAAFVLRRLVPEADSDSYSEYRWVTGTEESKGGQRGAKTPGVWERVTNETDVPDREERHSMFPQSYDPKSPMEAMKGRRFLWSGLIPVAQRDAYETAQIEDAPNAEAGGSVPEDPRRVEFDTYVVQPFQTLRESLYDNSGYADDLPDSADVRDTLLFAWLDFWTFLEDHLPTVAEAVTKDRFPKSTGDAERGRERTALFRTLNSLSFQSELGTLGTTAAEILRNVSEQADQIAAGNLDAVLAADELPVLVPDADEEEGGVAAVLNTLLHPSTRSDPDAAPEFQKKVVAALAPPETGSDGSQGVQIPTADPTTGGTYVVRCLYERPQCPDPLVVSERSAPFRMASFFDSNAPARDVNITLPSASLSDLRASSQSVTMTLTTELRNQVERVQDLTLEELQDGEGGSSPGHNIGMICSLSIPIITICALVLLIIIVTLLNIVFWWLPFFKICFPLPGGNGN